LALAYYPQHGVRNRSNAEYVAASKPPRRRYRGHLHRHRDRGGREGLANHVVESSREAVLGAIRKLPNGSWRNIMIVDGYDEPVTLAAKLTISGAGIAVDYAGTSAQSRRSNHPLILQAAFDRVLHPARGRDGGRDGERGSLSLRSAGTKLKGKGAQEIPPGESLVVHKPGGAGLGEPSERDKSLIKRDLRDELVSPAQLASDYGIALQAAE
jgi:N-methylhydantoinase B/oxoprolinase/acetone carboxylase alpha subunit